MHIMVDIEALGFGERGRILQLSAVAFELNGAVLDPHELLQYEDRWFNCYVGTYDRGDWNYTNSACEFWDAPEQVKARQLINALPSSDIYGVLVQFNSFARQWLGKRGFVWAKPISFDLNLLRGNFAGQNIEPAWHPSVELDLRTLLWAAKKMPKQNFKIPDMVGLGLTKHYALHDAAIQAVTAQSAYCALTVSVGQHFSAARKVVKPTA